MQAQEAARLGGVRGRESTCARTVRRWGGRNLRHTYARMHAHAHDCACTQTRTCTYAFTQTHTHARTNTHTDTLRTRTHLSVLLSDLFSFLSHLSTLTYFQKRAQLDSISHTKVHTRPFLTSIITSSPFSLLPALPSPPFLQVGVVPVEEEDRATRRILITLGSNRSVSTELDVINNG
jgi:hypothetical protein